ncbi:helix-turn-helix domain-containing protein [Cellulomonas sp. Y8]|uniref:helix-turn-helix domain-containing protein n=1 Tax=Cellulomonas sp. Y8 TaxID=2591145 RepID=UPI003D751E0E
MKLGEAANLSPSYISLIESGRRAPSRQALEAMAPLLGTDVLHLAEGWEGIDSAIRLAVDFAKLDLAAGDAPAARDRLKAIDLEAAGRATRAQALTVLAEAHEVCGELERAIEILEAVLEDAHAREDHFDAAAAAMALVTSCIESGDLIRAGEVGLSELANLEAGGLAGTDEHLRLGAALLWAYTERGDLVAATARAARLVAQAEELGSPRGRGSVYWNAALLAEQRLDYGLAKRYTERALALLGEYDSVRDLPRLRLHYAHLLLVSSPATPDEALEQLDRAQPALVAAGSPLEVATLETERARAHLLGGDAHAARDLAAQALDRLGDQPRLEASEAHLVLGDAHQALGEPEEAMAAYRWAAERLGMMSASRRAAGAWRKLADRYRAAGELELALEAFERGMSEAGFPAAPLPSRIFTA